MLSSANNADDILAYWFGDVESATVPSEDRTQIWFGHNMRVDVEIRDCFRDDLVRAVAGQYDDWEQDPRGTLALIILFDQFPRCIFRHTAEAYQHDQKALDLCLQGIDREFDHALSLLERVFYYFPLMHSEGPAVQGYSIRAYELLYGLALPETKRVYRLMLEHVQQRSDIIARFGRFPQRNRILGRASTPDELAFLKDVE